MMLNLNSNNFFQQKSYAIKHSFRPIIITDNLKTPENIGQIIRLAGNIGCEDVLVVNDSERPRLSKIKRMGEVAGPVVNWQFCTSDELFSHIPEGYILTALETAPQSTNLFNTTLPQKMALIVGNEINGISPLLLQKVEVSIHIPVTGNVKSLNVSHAAAVCLFEWLKQQIQ